MDIEKIKEDDIAAQYKFYTRPDNYGIIEINKVRVPVFEVSAEYIHFLLGMDEQLILNLIKKQNEFERFPGLKVGSITEASTDGNWEF